MSRFEMDSLLTCCEGIEKHIIFLFVFSLMCLIIDQKPKTSYSKSFLLMKIQKSFFDLSCGSNCFLITAIFKFALTYLWNLVVFNN